jgi:UDPglucose--hexose-1-phosphate uridylyltransferase
VAPADCPFCPGNESETEPEIAALRDAGSTPDAPGWRVRVVPNRFPALSAEVGDAHGERELFDRRPGFGRHEVVVEGERHTRSVTELPPERLDEVFAVYRERFRSLAGVPGLASAVLIKNVGRAAGASIEHSHSQLIATPVVPPLLEAELLAARAFAERDGSCLVCALLDAERRDGSRIACEGEHLVALCPWAPRFAYETWVLPARCEPRFEAVSDAVLAELAAITRRVLRGIEACLDCPPYNYVIHSAPFAAPPVSHHWRLAVMPRITHAAGYEQSTGLYINPVLPENAARRLRDAIGAAGVRP